LHTCLSAFCSKPMLCCCHMHGKCGWTSMSGSTAAD
jgi:hypothetical protein